MTRIRMQASALIPAPPERIHAILADYRGAHQAILPRPYFTGVQIERGGQGAGTVLRVSMQVYGRKYAYHQVVSEPEPGRVITETEMDTGQSTSFIIDPLAGGREARVTITGDFPASPGLAGWVERLVQPAITRRIFEQELRNLADYVRVHP